MADEQFILMPQQGLLAGDTEAASLLTALPHATSTTPPVSATLHSMPGAPFRIIDTLRENGPKLVEMDAGLAAAINADAATPLRTVQVVTYDAPEPYGWLAAMSDGASALAPPTDVLGAAFTIECRRSDTHRPVAGARVVATTNGGATASGTTDAAGRVELALGDASVVDRLWIITGPDLWGAYRTRVPIRPGTTISMNIEPVVLPYRDAVAHYYGASEFEQRTGVTVGIIDSGVGPHPDLNLVGGRNTVTGEPASSHHDWKGHGTHVAGLVGASPSAKAGVRGLAPGVALRAYRVFGQGARGATNYAIMKAMILAAADGCDILNLSLGGGPRESIVEEAIRDARDRGMLVIIAAGNNSRQPVAYPAAYAGAVAVSALGAEGCFPEGASCEADVVRPPAAAEAHQEFVAGFSNYGPQIACAGLGVGVISTLPDGRYGPSSGTSMAAPVVVGAAACLLSRNQEVFEMPRDRTRSDAMERMLFHACTKRGFGAEYEGYGLPDPAEVGAWPSTS